VYRKPICPMWWARNTAHLTETGIQHIGNDPGNDVPVEDVEQLAVM
jgi:hypothetical protein